MKHRTSGNGARVTHPRTHPVSLGRRFILCEQTDDPERTEANLQLFAEDGSLSWEELLKKRRVVVLAEAGSGKTTELEEQARHVQERGDFAFLSTVQNVGEKGLSSALRSHTTALSTWRSSDQPAWFFLDSVDEAKGVQIRLADALREVAQGISGCEGRSYIVFSGRPSDWEFRRDLRDLERLLPLPPPDEALSPINPDELLVQYIRHEEAKEPAPAEDPLIVIMAPLTRAQVKTFAREQGVTDSEAFLKAIERADLWRFARRPLDLQWLVDYWRAKGAFGSFAQMLELSLRTRLQESDPHRARSDPLEQRRAYQALTRIGAALVREKVKYVLVPDSSIDFREGRKGLLLAGVLPEWSARDLTYLINRAVFDPVVAGLVRLHQDNEGEVRSYLAARWLKHLIDENCPRPAIHELLFATTYGLELIIPSMRQTAAWLALWDAETAGEILRRDPQLLMQAGDPASLPAATREALLHVVVQHLDTEEAGDAGSLSHLQRYVRPDMAPVVRELWTENGPVLPVRRLLLELIWLGVLAECGDLAEQVAFDAEIDHRTQLWAGRALLATGTKATRQRYAEWVLAHARSFAQAAIWEALEELFPNEIGVTELLKLLDTLDLAGTEWRLDRLAGTLVHRLQDLSSVEQLLAGLLARVNSVEGVDDEPNDSLITAIEEASERMLTLLQPTEVSPQVLDGVLKARLHRGYRSRPKEALAKEISASPERRRAMFWHAAAAMANTDVLKGNPPTEWWQFRVLEFVPSLERVDLDWLLADANDRPSEHQRRLAADTAMELRQRFDLGDEPVEQLRRIGASHPEVLAVLTGWLTPRTLTPEVRASRERLARLEERNSIQQAQNEQSWVTFAQKIRANPGQLREIRPPTETSLDARLYHLWDLLRGIGRNQNRFAFDSLDALVPVIGHEAIEPLREAFVRFWRHWKPTLRSERPAEQRNVIANFDCIGLAGVSLEAASSSGWPRDLTESEAVRAAGYATLELNGFPAWITSLAAQWPNVVREVLVRELIAELEIASPTDGGGILQDVRYATVEVQRLVAPYLFDLIKRQSNLPHRVLDQILYTLTQGVEDSAELVRYLLERIAADTDPQHLAKYFEYAFQLSPGKTFAALKRILEKQEKSEQKHLMEIILPQICGGRYGDNATALQKAPFETLLQLIRLAYRTIRVADDNDHRDGAVYVPNTRDDAEGARSVLFRVLVETPGEATYQALLKLRSVKDVTLTIPASRLTSLAGQRAAADSEFNPWAAEDVAAFERDYLFAPRNPFDLQRLVQRHLTGMQHDLMNADFAQGITLARQPNERDVQIWIAGYLDMRGKRSYSVERESHVADEKEPDMRFRAKSSDASVPMEIKIAERWTLAELEEALTVQLVRRYLRDQHNRWGTLLLVHQKPHRWRQNGHLSIDKVVAHLRMVASRIASARPSAPQPSVELLDVSALDTTGHRRRLKEMRRPKSAAGRRKNASTTRLKAKLETRRTRLRQTQRR